jgi:hypothetical protein
MEVVKLIITPEHIIKKYFPEPIETTRELYERLGFEESVYPYSKWIDDAEKYCLSQYLDESQYTLIPDSEEKNFRITQKAFRVLLESSPSKIGDEIRASFAEISERAAKDPGFLKKLQDQLDQEMGLEKVEPKVSKKLKAKYNQSGQDAFEFSIREDNRVHFDIISGYNFQPGDQIKDAGFWFKLVIEQDIPYHIVDISITLNNEKNFTYRTIWSCMEEREKYPLIHLSRIIRINLFGDNRKLVDSHDYHFSTSQLNGLGADLQKALDLLLEFKPVEGLDLAQLGEKILHSYKLNDQAYAEATSQLVPVMMDYKTRATAEMLEKAFHEAVDKYWEYYVLQDDPTQTINDDLKQMIEDRKPRVTLALSVFNMLDQPELIEKYFHKKYSEKQMDVISIEGSLRLIFSLVEAEGLDPEADHQKRMDDISAIIAEHFDFIEQILEDMGQWPK